MSFSVLAKAVLLVCVLAASASAMFEDNEAGARPEGMGGAFTAVADDVSAIDLNPAGLFQLERVSGLAYGKLLYGGAGAGLHTATVAGCVPVRRVGTFGVRLQESGLSEMSERSLKLAHGFRLANDLAFGYGLNAYNLVQQDYGQGFAFGVDVGMFARIYKVWSLGFYAHNLNMPELGGHELPRLLVFGLGFSPSPGISSALDVSKEPGMPTRVAIGQEFRIIEDYLTVRAGVQTEPVSLGFGLRSGYKFLHVDYAFRTHPSMPATHSVGLVVEL